MSGRQLTLLLTLWTLLPWLTPALRGADAPPPQPDLSAQRQTVKDLRAVGTAMFLWWKVEMAPKRSAEAIQRAEAFDKEAEASTVSVDMGSIPEVSHDELAKILVPKYLPALPEKDGWGNPYELRLQTQDADALHVMAVRSAGQDGHFSGSDYKIEGFSALDQAQDLAWMDGYFIHWPEVGK